MLLVCYVAYDCRRSLHGMLPADLYYATNAVAGGITPIETGC